MAILGLGESAKKDTKQSKKDAKDSKKKTDSSDQVEAKALLKKMEMKDGEDCPFC